MKPLIDALAAHRADRRRTQGRQPRAARRPDRQHRQLRQGRAAFSTACERARRVRHEVALICWAMTDDKMLARIAALLRQAEGTDNAHEAEAFMAAAQRLATATSIDLAVARSHSHRTHQGADAGAAHHHHRQRGRARAAHLCAAVRRDRARQRREVRHRLELDVRVRLRLRRGHRCQPCALRQPGDADGEGVGGLHRLRRSTSRRRRSPRASTSSWPSAPASASGWPRRATRRGTRPPRADAGSPAPRSRCGTRISSSRTSTARRPRPAAPGGPPARRPVIRPRRGVPETARVNAPGWADSGDSTARAPR